MPKARWSTLSLHVVFPALLILVLTRPLLFGGSDRGTDFYTHYWYVWHQSEALRHGGPSLYLHNLDSVFVPIYAFYGGTLYVIAGALAIVLGSPLHGYVTTFLLGFAAAYGGWWWLSRQAGLGRTLAHVPGLLFATSAYGITNIYTRGAWPEHMAVSMLPLVVASGLSVVRSDRLRLGPTVALGLSTVIFAGSHNLTLLTGTTVVTAIGALLFICVPAARQMVTTGGLLRLGAILVPAVLVDAWFLLPDITYQSKTFIAHQTETWREFLVTFEPLVAPKHLFSLGRGTSDVVVPKFAFSLPVLAMLWSVVGLVVARPRWRNPWLRVVVVLALIASSLIVVMTHVELLVGPFVLMQFSYRLESFINLVISGAVLAVLVLLQGRATRASRVALWAVVPVVATSVVLGAAQVIVHRDPATYLEWRTFPDFYNSWSDSNRNVRDYSSGELQRVDSRSLPLLTFPVSKLRDNSITVTINLAAGQVVATNLVTIPELIRLTGAHAVGVDPRGGAVLKIDRERVPGNAVITVKPSSPPAARIGRLLSLLGLAGLAAGVFTAGLGTWQRRSPRKARSQVAAG
jgi:uncharacterized membrane protein